jgi:hypothetical protein
MGQHPISTSFTGLSGWALLGFTVIVLMIASAVRVHSKPVVSAVQSWPGVSKSKAAKRGLDGTHTLLSILALLLFAIAGIAASATPLASAVTWASQHIDAWVSHLPMIGKIIGNLGVGIVAIFALRKGLGLLPDILRGKAHQGEADLLVFAGPMIFPLVPGLFGEFWVRVYNLLGSAIGSHVAHILHL